jgi:hypothetical protein
MKSSISRLCLALIFSACASAQTNEYDGPVTPAVEPVGIALRVDNQAMDPVALYLSDPPARLGEVSSQNHREITFPKTQIKNALTVTLILRDGHVFTLPPMVVGRYDWCYKITVDHYIRFSTIEACE